MLSPRAGITGMRRMHLTSLPDVSVRFAGGVAVFCDPHTYFNPIKGAVNAPGFVAAIVIRPKYVAGAQLHTFRILAKSYNARALGEIELDLPA